VNDKHLDGFILGPIADKATLSFHADFIATTPDGRTLAIPAGSTARERAEDEAQPLVPRPLPASVRSPSALVAWLRAEAAGYTALADKQPKGREKATAGAFAGVCRLLADDLDAAVQRGEVPVGVVPPIMLAVPAIEPVEQAIAAGAVQRADLRIEPLTSIGARDAGWQISAATPAGQAWIDAYAKRPTA
jgi:hypothetical protein